MTWTPIYPDPVVWPDPTDTHSGGFTKATWAAWRRAHPERCRDCGTTKHINAGGSDPHAFWLCDQCADITGCHDTTYRGKAGCHASHYGHIHPAADHRKLVEARERRRNTWLRAHPEARQEALPL